MAFVLHSISGLTVVEYLAFAKEIFQRDRTYVTDYPKSVHYLVGDDNVVYQLVELHDRAWGIYALVEPSWPLLNKCEWTDYEDLFIHIGIIGDKPTTAQLALVSEIICCVNVIDAAINIPVNEYGVIVARDLNINLECLWSVPNSVIPKAQVCVQQGGKDPFRIDDIGSYGNRISDLEDWRKRTEEDLIDLNVCCCENRKAIQDINDRLDEIEEQLAKINIDSILQRLEALEEGNNAILKRLQIIEDCLECNNLCGPVNAVNVVYRSDAETPIKLVPGAIQVLNLPIKISDTSPVPIVNTGPLWYANLQEEVQKSCSKFRVELTVQVSSSGWCAGRTLEAYAIINSQNVLLDTYTSSGGNQTAIVSGSTEFNVPPDTVVQVGVKTDEDTAPLEIAMATVVIKCLDGTISPNCRDCGPC